ncbi:MAG TPA: cytochrome D1 domain-containing protein [Steroidobacteraceae bacterium]|nr:cytochrome D1 domain-containing protein [Steroidobacteraceae bacterium]
MQTGYRLAALRALLVALPLTLLAACGGSQPPPASDIATDSVATPGASVPGAVADAEPVPPLEIGGYRVLVTNERSGDLSVIDGPTRKVIATLPLGKRPRGLKISPDHKLLYVALSGSPIAPPGTDESTLPPADKGADGIGVVDLESLQLVTVLRGVSDPEQLAVNADGTKLYIASEDTGQAVVMNAVSGAVLATMPVGGEPEGVTLSPDGRWVYMSSEEDHQIAVIDTQTDKVVATLDVGLRPRFTEFSDDGALAFISAENDGTVTVADARTHKVLRTWKLEGGDLVRPVGMTVSHDGKLLYTVTGRGQTLVAIEVATGKQVASVEVGPRPWGVAVSPDGQTLFTANGGSNDVSVVDAASMQITSKIPVGGSPWGLVILTPR